MHLNLCRWVAYSAIVVALVALGSGNASAEDNAQARQPDKIPSKDGLTVYWQSTARTAPSSDGQFGSLYESLFRLKQAGFTFPTKTVTKQPTDSFRQLLVNNGLYFGDSMPAQVDITLCALNPNSCKLVEQTGGQAPKTKWTYKEGDPIVVPDLWFIKIQINEPYTIKKGDALKNIVVDDRHGCEVLDKGCLDWVRTLNPDVSLSDPAKLPQGKQIVVPTASYATGISIRDTSLAGMATNDGSLSKLMQALTAPDRPDQPAAAQVDKATADRVVKALEPIRKNLIELSPLPGASTASYRALQRTSDPKEFRSEMWKSIHDDWPHDADEAGVGVAVLDGDFDKTHCDYDQDRIKVVDLRNLPVLPTPATGSPNETHDDHTLAGCGTITYNSSLSDHANHIAGIIAARTNAKGGVGLYPNTDLIMLMIDLQKFTQPPYVLALAAKLRSVIYPSTTRVINFSDGYTSFGSVDPLESQFFLDKPPVARRYLVVVSAGNEGVHVQRNVGTCSLRPACLSATDQHIMSVVALDWDEKNPQVLGGDMASNYGDRFDIAAPGLDVLSTVRNNRYGYMSGTSQAAPLVAAAAARLFAEIGDATPGIVKNRLIYTSDLAASLNGKAFGGRLNIHRAARYTDSTVIDIEGGGGTGRQHPCPPRLPSPRRRPVEPRRHKHGPAVTRRQTSRPAETRHVDHIPPVKNGRRSQQPHQAECHHQCPDWPRPKAGHDI